MTAQDSACQPLQARPSRGSISREGVLVGQGPDGTLMARTIRAEACGSCRAKAFCGVEVGQEKNAFPVQARGALKSGLEQGLYGPGTPLVLEQSLGQAGWAVFWGFGFPLLLFLGVLALVLFLTGNELQAALGAFASLPLGYGLIRLLGPRLFQQYEFTAVLAQEYP